MIQRIQSIYLLIAVAIMCLMCFVPLVTFSIGDGYYLLTALGYSLVNIAPLSESVFPYGVFALTVLAIVITFVSILKFKNRKLQLKWCMASIVVHFLYYGAVIAYSLSFANKIQSEFTPNWTLALPFCSLIVFLLARKNIKKDEALVRAADRIR